MHNLTIEVTTTSKDQPEPYILDYLWLCGAGNSTFESSTAQPETHSKTSNDGIIVGVVLGIVILFLALAPFALLSRIHKKAQRQETLGSSTPSDTLHTC